MSNEKNIMGPFAPLVKIHDESGNFHSLLNAFGFDVDPNQAELLALIAKWHRMVMNKEKIPNLDISNISKVRKMHYDFIVNYRTIEREKLQREANEAAIKRMEEYQSKQKEDKVLVMKRKD